MLRLRIGAVAAVLSSVVAVLLFVAVMAPTANAASPSINVAKSAKSGDILTDANGMTLYVFMNDRAGQSTCTGGCAQTWPPLTISQGDQPTVAGGVTGQVAVIQRSDGGFQVTYDQRPLYRYASDSKPGDTNGQGIGGVWFAAAPNGPAKAAAKAARYGKSNGYGKSSSYGSYGSYGGCRPYAGYGMSYGYKMPYRGNYGYAMPYRMGLRHAPRSFYPMGMMMRRY